MGWDFYCDPHFNKARVVAELNKGFDGTEHTYRIIDHAVVGNTLWQVVEVTPHDGPAQRRIWRTLLKGGGKGSGWGHKDVPYTEGLDCPKRLIDMVPADGTERDETWRIQCAEERHGRAQRAKRLKALIPGDKVRIYGHEYEIVRPAATRGWIVRQLENGRTYRATKDIHPV